MPFEADPKGFFLIHIAEGKILVEHYENVYKGKVLATGKADFVFEGTKPENIYRTLIQHGFVSRLDHAAYLGKELQRAEHCLKTGEKYVQE